MPNHNAQGRPKLPANERQDHKVSFNLNARLYGLVESRELRHGGRSNYFRFLLEADYRQFQAEKAKAEQGKRNSQAASDPKREIPMAEQLKAKSAELVEARKRVAELESQYQRLASALEAGALKERKNG